MATDFSLNWRWFKGNGAVLWIRITLLQIRIRIRLITLMRTRILILIDADPDAQPDQTFHPGADPHSDLDPTFQIKAQTLKQMLIFYKFWLVICKLMQIRIRSGSSVSLWCGSRPGFLFYSDADPGYQNDADPCTAMGEGGIIYELCYSPVRNWTCWVRACSISRWSGIWTYLEITKIFLNHAFETKTLQGKRRSTSF
jgi:hypothetical protein